MYMKGYIQVLSLKAMKKSNTLHAVMLPYSSRKCSFSSLIQSCVYLEVQLRIPRCCLILAYSAPVGVHRPHTPSLRNSFLFHDTIHDTFPRTDTMYDDIIMKRFEC